jgi:hypothetical protein
LITRKILGEKYRSLSPSLCSFAGGCHTFSKIRVSNFYLQINV